MNQTSDTPPSTSPSTPNTSPSTPSTPSTLSALSAIGVNNPSPREVYEQMERYLKEIEGLIMLLREGLAKGEEEVMTLRAFDVRAPQLNPDISIIDTTPLQNEIEKVRQRIISMEEMRGRVKSDIEKVKAIGEKIAGIMSQYRS